MGDIFGHRAHRLDHLRQPGQRCIDQHGYRIHIIGPSRHRQPGGQVTRRDLLHCRCHQCHPRLHPPGQHRPGDHRPGQHREGRPQQTVGNDFPKVIQIAIGLTDRQSIRPNRAGEQPIRIVAAYAKLSGIDIRPAGNSTDVCHIRAQDRPGRIAQLENRRPVRAGRNPGLYRLNQVWLVILLQRGLQCGENLLNAGVLPGGQLGMHQAIANAARQHQQGQNAERQGHGKAERGVSPQFSEAHARHTRCS